ncbi:MAG: 4Fe-4S binding protein [Sulfuricurvum sp.]|uniref:4Fe-4S binding protein n=1 Tax=Sulfuricurvum sp. TaxID=2025608 RepID=UPI002622EDDE|nr:4Fe-4S binding protein [Sulfuricurvum sp.]MDD2830024.1 4Fe-4S binding protein [Sulfuricurvum sp.]MDD4948897.1 4Fe-4S binding protein [Sulfuricurvum sp.]
MSFLILSPQSCVRALSVNSACLHCETSCPVNAIVISERLPSINQSQCVGCGGCVAVCPTEALKLDDFDPNELFFSLVSQDEIILSCQKNVPCLASMSPEQLIALAQLKGDIVCDIGHCHQCAIGEKVLHHFYPMIEDVNYLLEATQCSSQVLTKEIAYKEEELGVEVGRRDFFKTFHLKKIGSIKGDFEKEVQKSTDEFVTYTTDSSHTALLRAKKITDRRKLFFTAIKRSSEPTIFHVVDSTKMSFTSQKLLDESKCTACQMCYRICPTAALSSDVRNSKIDFDPFLCIKCHLCHDVCETDAITLSSSYNLKEWYAPTVQNLVTYLVRPCDECGGLFSSVAGEKICRRCQLEEEEALELWGLNEK